MARLRAGRAGQDVRTQRRLIYPARSRMICTAMPIRLVHLVDDQTREDAARLCSLLLHRLPAGEVSQQVVLMGARPATLNLPQAIPVGRVARPIVRPFLALPLERKLRRERPQAILAWSPLAGAAAGSYWRHATVGVAADPADAREWTRWAGAVGDGGSEMICTNATVRRRLIEAGTAADAAAVVRPGVDFAELRQARETMRREHLGLSPRGRVMLTMPPPSRAGGQYYAVWAAAILHHIWPEATLVVPGVSREQGRIGRLLETLYCPQVYRLTADRYSPPELLAVADALLVPALHDVPTGWIAWAMAAGVPIIGSAVPSVTEFVADRANGFLCRPGEPHTLAVRVRTAFESPEVMAGCVQAARHQAFETFRAERCVQEFLKIIRNLANRQPALTGVLDAALDV